MKIRKILAPLTLALTACNPSQETPSYDLDTYQRFCESQQEGHLLLHQKSLCTDHARKQIEQCLSNRQNHGTIQWSGEIAYVCGNFLWALREFKSQ